MQTCLNGVRFKAPSCLARSYYIAQGEYVQGPFDVHSGYMSVLVTRYTSVWYMAKETGNQSFRFMLAQTSQLPTPSHISRVELGNFTLAIMHDRKCVHTK